MRHQLETDGITVWVTDHEGTCIARFGRLGIDIHHNREGQIDTGSQCLHCTHEPTTEEDWHIFVAEVQKHHGVKVSRKFMPKRFKVAITA